MACFSKFVNHRWIERSVLEDVLALLRQLGLAKLLHAAKIAELRRTSGLGLFAPFISVLIHVALLGFVMSQVFGESVEKFMPFFAVSFCIWQAMTIFISEAVYVNERAYQYLAFSRLSGFIVPLINVMDFGLNLALKMAAAVIVISVVNFSVLVEANYLYFAVGWIFVLMTAALWSLPLAFLFDRFRFLRGFLPQVLFAIYLVSPILWEPKRIADHRWVVDFNPVFHLIEIIRQPILHGVFPFVSFGVLIFIALVGFVLTIVFYKKNRELVVFRWVA